MATKKKSTEDLRINKFLNRASSEVNGFAELLQRFERNISILGRSKRTFGNQSAEPAYRQTGTPSKGYQTPQKKAVILKNCFVALNAKNEIPIIGPSYC